MRRSFSAVFSAFLALALGVSLEWILLTGSSPQAVYKASIPPTPTPAIGSLPADFQTGVVFPQWGTTAYSATNENFTYGLQEIHDQTGARWVELTITLYQKDSIQTIRSQRADRHPGKPRRGHTHRASAWLQGLCRPALDRRRDWLGWRYPLPQAA